MIHCHLRKSLISAGAQDGPFLSFGIS
ncbi:hypothetical protein Patl1_04715 [Pistacia atlantica]|uniref:Uncharacterized protein n=1 Tax=Pistacia atlantica TaxID=434234 RepID=A0ACC1BUG5_9ROSI|nr:hypothetical protein Patl1_04715 [Pistacia atlantica]